jgi:hypothetical protein
MPTSTSSGDLVRDGLRFSAGDTTDALLEGFTVRFEAVAEAPQRDRLTWVDWCVQRRPFDALQLILPDTAGGWPQETAYRAFPQPLLG